MPVKSPFFLEINRVGRATMRKKVVVSLIVLLFSIGCGNTRPIVVAENLQRADRIILALYYFKEERSSFPESLEELVPNFLPEMPTMANGDGFFYTTKLVNGFHLSFRVRPGYGCGYTSRFERWECGRGD